MSELSRSDQLCLFEYLSGADEAPQSASQSASQPASQSASQSAGQLSSPSHLNDTLSSPTASNHAPIKESLAEVDIHASTSQTMGHESISLSSTNSTPFTEEFTTKQLRYVSKQASQFAAQSTQALENANTATEQASGEPPKDYSSSQYLANLPSPDTLSEEQERIFHLEQALDQALHYLDELNARVKHQATLEEQVTLTEEYAYVQYQAIARLQEDLAEHKEIINQRNLTITSLESDRTLAQTNLLSLQQDQLNLRQENAQWKNACQELQQECDRQHRKMLALEQENTVMQEQILQQARQSNEHETAVQYWKDRYTSIQQNLQEFQAVLTEKIRSMNDGNEDNGFESLLARIDLIGQEDNQSRETNLPTPNLNSFSIPDFLIRRYRQRGSGTAAFRPNHPPSNHTDS